MDKSKPSKKVMVGFHGHEWPVYPLKSRNSTVYRVIHRINGERRPKTFSTLKKARADALDILKEIYAKGDGKIHLTADEKLDWKSAVGVLTQAGIRSSLETVCRHYADLAKAVGGTALLMDVARKHASTRRNTVTPIKLTALREAYVAALKKKDLSVRHIEVEESHSGQFVTYAKDSTTSDQVTRELLQDFIDSKKGVVPRTKENLLNSVKAMMTFGKSNRNVPPEWDEADHVVMPVIKPAPVKTFTPEQLKQLLAAAPAKFEPILALAAFAGIRSSEIELLDWKHIRLLEKEPRDRIIKLDVDVTEASSKRTIPINDTLHEWLASPFKRKGKIWTGKHNAFYWLQQKIADKAGVQWLQNALRHTCISAKVALTKDVPKVAYESGNSVAVIKCYYLDLMTPSVAEAWFAVTPIVVYQYKKEKAKS
jgi:integrase